ncbi:hypothetical protein BPAE_0022g00390 [Botrytis paeoniae]|uniref:Uncharacterized protein n=1 Tax=Botrytis paeoniae TaxID=278948 RepID=A0A4Z1G1D8_9HELO|nr:hypothetical protein BPAE_0022g00390 [Botrytis paeoniae]
MKKEKKKERKEYLGSNRTFVNPVNRVEPSSPVIIVSEYSSGSRSHSGTNQKNSPPNSYLLVISDLEPPARNPSSIKFRKLEEVLISNSPRATNFIEDIQQYFLAFGKLTH